jgi:hypothetical protein
MATPWQVHRGTRVAMTRLPVRATLASSSPAWGNTFDTPFNRNNNKSMKNTNSNKKKLSPEQRDELLRALKARFEKNMKRHKGLEWAKVQAKLEANPVL